MINWLKNNTMKQSIYKLKAKQLAKRLTASEAYIEAFIYSAYGHAIGITVCYLIACERFNKIKGDPYLQ